MAYVLFVGVSALEKKTEATTDYTDQNWL
jgi:hypothetical protein